ncbi:Tetraspanin family protein [Entamoeba marina]
MEKQTISKLVLLIFGIAVTILSTALLFITVFGPIKNMPNTEKVIKSDFRIYSKTVYMIIMIALTALFLLCGVVMIITSLVGKDWMCMLSYIVIGLGIVCALAFAVYFTFVFTSFKRTTDTNLKTLAHWEDIFECCGWDTYRDMPPCASSIGAQTKHTCSTVTHPIRAASLQNFILGYIFFLILIAGVVMLSITSATLYTSRNDGFDRID